MTEEWKAKWAGQFASGALVYKFCVMKRGRLKGNVTVALNEATQFTKTVKNSIKEGKGVPNTVANINATRMWLMKIEENVTKLYFFNEKMKGFFGPADRQDTNADWMTTSQYCNYYVNNFLATRENLFKILFFLIDHADKDRILEAVEKSRMNFATIAVPEGDLREGLPEASAADQVLLLEDEAMLHGFDDQGEAVGGGNLEDDDFDGEELNATMRRNPGANADVTFGGLPFGGARMRTPAPFPTSTTSDIFPGQTNTVTTSTIKNPIHFGNLRRQGQGEYELFNGPSIFSNALGVGQRGEEGAKKSPWEEVRLGPRIAAPQEIRSNQIVTDRANGDAATLVQMFSNSLTSTFSAKNIIEHKWDGDPSTWERFAFAWTKCHSHMESLHMSDAAKFSELLKCVTGTAKLYVESLPSFLDSSYWTSLQLLQNVYSSRKTTVRTIVNKLVSMPTCQPTYESRLKLHAQICSYKASLNAISMNPEDALLAWELIFIENSFDFELKKQWVRYCEKHRNIDAPLGYNLTFDGLSNQILKFITESYKISGENRPHVRGAQGQGGQGQGGRKWIGSAAAAAASVEDAPQAKQKAQKSGKPQGGKKGAGKNGSSTTSSISGTTAAFAPRSPPPPKNQFQGRKNGAGGANKTSLFKSGCAFCQKDNGFNAHAHRWNLGCPLIKLDVLPAEKIREIVRQKRLCQACLMPGHEITTCTSPDYVKCSVENCGKKHFRAFHNRPAFHNRSEQKKVTWTAAAANESQ